MLKAFKRLIITLTSLLAIYSWLGFLMVPSVALKLINDQLGVYANSPAHLQRLEFNPFSFELNAWDFHIGEADNKQISLQQLYGKLSPGNLRNKTVHLQDVQLTEPVGQVIFNKQGQLNLAQLFNLPEAQDKLDDDTSTPFAVLIDTLHLQQGNLRFNDQRQQDQVDVTLADLNITLNNFDTRPASNSELQLTALASDGTQLQWQGNISLNPLASQGHLQLQDAQLKSWWPYVREHFTAQLKDGKLNLDTHYELELTPTLQFKANKLSAQLNSLALAQQQQPLANMASLSINDAELDQAKQKIQIGKATSSKLEAWAEIDKNGVVNWQKLLPSLAADKSTADKKAPAKNINADNSKAQWRIIVKQADLAGHTFHLADNSRSEPLSLELSDFNLRIKDFDSQAKAPFNAELSSKIGEQGRINSNAQILLQPLNVDMTVNSSDIDLRPAQNWISPYAHIELRSGLLSSALKVKISDPDNLQLTVAGDASITQLDVQDNLRQRDLLKWQTVDIKGIQYGLQQQKLSINKVALQEPYVRFIINEDLTTNISQLMIPQPDKPAAQKKADSPEFAMHIGGIEVKDGSANFADFSLTPNFATAIQQLNGTIGTIDNTTNSVAKVDIKGNVDRYAPVTIKGSLMPFDPLKQLDIATSFKHVELTTLTPYSGKFAGYRIHKGRLNLDLHYKITDGKLNATNTLLLEQLQLGERVDSPDAVNLPIRLAIALLKDSKGRIALDLPVSGDLNNPEFKVGPIIWQTLRNLITRAASAPFNFIAGLANGKGEELNEVVFMPGEFSVNPEAAKGLDQLAQALTERPQLRLEVEGGSLAKLDGPILAQMRLTSAYQNAWYSILQRRGTKIESSKDTLEVPEKEKAALLEGIYRTALKQQPPAEWAKLKKDERAQNMQNAVLQSYAQSALGLRRLAQARANSIKEYLIEHAKLDAERVYLIDVSEGKAADNQGVVSTLHLGSM